MTRTLTVNLYDFDDEPAAGEKVTVELLHTAAVAADAPKPARHVRRYKKTVATDDDGIATFDLIPSQDFHPERFYRVEWTGFLAEFLMPDRADTLYAVLDDADLIPSGGGSGSGGDSGSGSGGGVGGNEFTDALKSKLEGIESEATKDQTGSEIVSAVNSSSSTLNAARIASLAASKITSGIFAVARIPGLAASKITSGILAVARIPDLAASKITSGTLGTARIPDLAASKITSGTIDEARLPDGIGGGGPALTGTDDPTSSIGTDGGTYVQVTETDERLVAVWTRDDADSSWVKIADASQIVHPDSDGALPDADDHRGWWALTNQGVQKSIVLHRAGTAFKRYGPDRVVLSGEPARGTQENNYQGDFASPPNIANYSINEILWDEGSQVWLIKPSSSSTLWSSYSGPLGWHRGGVYYDEADAERHVDETGRVVIIGEGTGQHAFISTAYTAPADEVWGWVPTGITLAVLALKADKNLGNVSGLSNTEKSNAQTELGVTAEIDELAESKADTNLSNVDSDLGDNAKSAFRTKVGAAAAGSDGMQAASFADLTGQIVDSQVPSSFTRDTELADLVEIAAYSTTATYSRGSANSIVTFGTGLYVYISGQQRNSGHSPDDHPEYWMDLVRGAEVVVVGSGSHRFKGGTLAIIDDDVYLATTAISTPRNAAWIADHSDSGEEFIHLTGSDGGGASSFSDLSGTVTAAQLPSATTSAKGIVELATNDEADTGTDLTRAMTPSRVKRVADRKADTNLQNIGSALSSNEKTTIQDRLGVSDEIDDLALSKANTNLSNVDDDLTSSAQDTIKAKLGLSDNDGFTHEEISQADYDALATPDAAKIYLVPGGGGGAASVAAFSAQLTAADLDTTSPSAQNGDQALQITTATTHFNKGGFTVTDNGVGVAVRSRVSVPEDGLYLVSFGASVDTTSSASSRRFTALGRVAVNDDPISGVAFYDGSSGYFRGAGYEDLPSVSGSVLLELTTADTVTVYVAADPQETNQNFRIEAANSHFSIVRLPGNPNPVAHGNDNSITGADGEFIVTDIDVPTTGTWGFVNAGDIGGQRAGTWHRFLLADLTTRSNVAAGTIPSDANALSFPLDQGTDFWLGQTSGDKVAVAASDETKLPGDLRVRTS